ncbi:MAG: S8 family peptidase [Pirellulaceae bacterium]
MADENARRLPVKIVIPQEGDVFSRPGGGSGRKVFGEVDRGVRQNLLTQISEVRSHFAGALQTQSLPAVARVVLKEDSLAKSHRPRRLFSEDTCPVIGSQAFGQLFVSVDAQGLSRLENRIDTGTTRDIEADISTVSRIEPYTAENALGTLGAIGIKSYIEKSSTDKLKLKLFCHGDTEADDAVLTAFLALLRELGLEEAEQVAYASHLRVYRLRGVTADVVPRLASFVGTQSLSPFPQFGLFAQYIPTGTPDESTFPPPQPNVNYPVVGVIDSGTDPRNRFLTPWVLDRDEEDVPASDQDNNHGSFVAGLIANGRILNHDDVRFPSAQARVIDVVAMPKVGTPVFEDDLLATIRRVIKKYPNCKVWNLSISKVSDLCTDEAFSDFAIALDDLQESHDVTFVICAGNYSKRPFRSWPAEDLAGADRVSPPADSIHALTVGAVAHADHASTCVKNSEPSPFSRRGPGAAYLPKPEVCHIGGNCDSTGNCRQVGVLSLDGAGNLAEAIGTSFSTPLVSAILANVRAGVTEPISRNLAKALVVQSAALASDPVTAAELPYRGYGVPGELGHSHLCTVAGNSSYSSLELHPHRRTFAKEDFPIPDCFRRPDNKVEGEFLMTLVYDPPREATAGANTAV